MLIHSGIILLKYWFSVSEAEQEKRFKARINDPVKRWKLSPIDLKSRELYTEYSKAKDEMFTYTDTKISPWFMVEADNKLRAYLNCIHHMLSVIPYEEIPQEPIELLPRKESKGYVRPPIEEMSFVPGVY
jgi:polyphosphate kinase 2 (PPK2 family)